MKKIILNIIIIMMVICPKVLFAEDQNYLLLEGKKVKLGATIAQVKASFENMYGVTMVMNDEQNDLSITYNTSGVGSIGEEHRYIGNITFKKGLVVEIHKQWSGYYANIGGLESFNSLYGALADFTNNNKLTAQIWTKEINQPSGQASGIVIKKGNRTLVISLCDDAIGTKRKVINIDEYLSK